MFTFPEKVVFWKDVVTIGSFGMSWRDLYELLVGVWALLDIGKAVMERISVQN